MSDRPHRHGLLLLFWGNRSDPQPLDGCAELPLVSLGDVDDSDGDVDDVGGTDELSVGGTGGNGCDGDVVGVDGVVGVEGCGVC